MSFQLTYLQRESYVKMPVSAFSSVIGSGVAIALHGPHVGDWLGNEKCYRQACFAGGINHFVWI